MGNVWEDDSGGKLGVTPVGVSGNEVPGSQLQLGF